MIQTKVLLHQTGPDATPEQLLWLGDWSKVIVKTGSHSYPWNQEVVQPHLTTRTAGGKGVDSHMPLAIKEDVALGQVKVHDLQGW